MTKKLKKKTLKEKKIKKKNEVIFEIDENKGATDNHIRIISRTIKSFPGNIVPKLKIITTTGDCFLLDQIGYKISYDGVKKLESLTKGNPWFQVHKLWVDIPEN